MKIDPNFPYTIIDVFSELGFTAGFTLKGAWGSSDNMYRFVREDIIPAYMQLVVPDQVHGVDIINFDNDMKDFSITADGVMTRCNDLCLSVTTADCLPLILADTSSGIFAAVHVGWRSFIGGIIEKLFRQGLTLGLKPDTTHIFIGPGIADCCFEVGIDVAILFDENFIHQRNDSYFIDMKGAVENKLESLGISKRNIDNLSECTSCRSDLYYSYRRDKDTPLQMVTFIYKSK
jgi:polyphenol oxidase